MDSIAEVMNPVEAAEYLRISRRTLDRMREAGELPHVILPTGGTGTRQRVRYRKVDLDRWLSGRVRLPA